MYKDIIIFSQRHMITDKLNDFQPKEDDQNNIDKLTIRAIKEVEIGKLPDDVSISTMTITCYLGTLFNVEIIDKYMSLDDNDIIAIKSKKNGLRCIDKYKSSSKSMNKNSGKNFYNQLTIIVKIYDGRFLNIKLFKNGSIQISGCKKLEHSLYLRI